LWWWCREEEGAEAEEEEEEAWRREHDIEVEVEAAAAAAPAPLVLASLPLALLSSRCAHAPPAHTTPLPQALLCLHSPVLLASGLANPKSHSLTSAPREDTSTFSGLTSLWTTPRACR
jgi:hypothetical protein